MLLPVVGGGVGASPRRVRLGRPAEILAVVTGFRVVAGGGAGSGSGSTSSAAAFVVFRVRVEDLAVKSIGRPGNPQPPRDSPHAAAPHTPGGGGGPPPATAACEEEGWPGHWECAGQPGASWDQRGAASSASPSSSSWVLEKRYSDFDKLRQHVAARLPLQLSFPPKTPYRRTDKSHLEERRRVLNVFLQQLTRCRACMCDPSVLAFFGAHPTTPANKGPPYEPHIDAAAGPPPPSGCGDSVDPVLAASLSDGRFTATALVQLRPSDESHPLLFVVSEDTSLHSRFEGYLDRLKLPWEPRVPTRSTGKLALWRRQRPTTTLQQQQHNNNNHSGLGPDGLGFLPERLPSHISRRSRGELDALSCCWVHFFDVPVSSCASLRAAEVDFELYVGFQGGGVCPVTRSNAAPRSCSPKRGLMAANTQSHEGGGGLGEAARGSEGGEGSVGRIPEGRLSHRDDRSTVVDEEEREKEDRLDHLASFEASAPPPSSSSFAVAAKVAAGEADHYSNNSNNNNNNSNNNYSNNNNNNNSSNNNNSTAAAAARGGGGSSPASSRADVDWCCVVVGEGIVSHDQPAQVPHLQVLRRADREWLISVGSADGRVKVYDLQQRQVLSDSSAAIEGGVTAILCVDALELLFLGSSTGGLYVAPLHALPPTISIGAHQHHKAITAIAASPDSTMIYTGSRDGSVGLWRVGASSTSLLPRFISRVGAAAAPITCMVLLPSSGELLCGEQRVTEGSW
eukprot:GHVU01223838.1.p1 GENE.GHVU01223838.1~~GHVU01223838.1.p1  ORF type:complete len:738 (+),score=147.03 GHVU01223838.1:471-2684(+)